MKIKIKMEMEMEMGMQMQMQIQMQITRLIVVGHVFKARVLFWPGSDDCLHRWRFRFDGRCADEGRIRLSRVNNRLEFR